MELISTMPSILQPPTSPPNELDLGVFVACAGTGTEADESMIGADDHKPRIHPRLKVQSSILPTPKVEVFSESIWSISSPRRRMREDFAARRREVEGMGPGVCLDAKFEDTKSSSSSKAIGGGSSCPFGRRGFR